ncbi:type III secretion protein [Brenneria goodwinii]|uniref:Type III secretion protein n=1 Tax=Brenneria goodwinii TaxID=1109412 RepID=A0AAE8ERX5_9GAMM|nr:type III secretion system chaperone [Brenneria goodwinii]ATA24171.1 type III secretion protein [Brenneria goodwinii]MCG8155233.1 type III secretion protein [Brenneria goodwinii]MCG8159477.1 type III secretion protein [Brenneria goodwinii]MCG8164354.1 type III secretion protein [Brenneria goodwinii]MCG8169080.1 type III secretion protein [Brenneria goodwinii]
MTSTELAASLENWLNGMTAMLRLEIDNGPVALVRHARGIACCAAIPLPMSADETVLERALLLADSAGRQYGEDAAALSLSPQDEQLWLWMKHEPDDALQLCRCLETLLNQRDVWQGMLLPTLRSAAAGPLSLNTLAFLQGERHA